MVRGMFSDQVAAPASARSIKGPISGPDLRPDVAEARAERRGMLVAQDLRVGVVVEEDEVGPERHEHREARAQDQAQRRPQARRPALRPPERRAGPVVGAHPRAHRAALREEGQIRGPDGLGHGTGTGSAMGSAPAWRHRSGRGARLTGRPRAGAEGPYGARSAIGAPARGPVQLHRSSRARRTPRPVWRTPSGRLRRSCRGPRSAGAAPVGGPPGRRRPCPRVPRRGTASARSRRCRRRRPWSGRWCRRSR